MKKTSFLLASLSLSALLAQPSQARIPNIPCVLAEGLTLPVEGAPVPPEQQVAQPCTNKRILILSEATRNDPVFFKTQGIPKLFNCVILIGGPITTEAVASNDNNLYGALLELLAQGSLPAVDAQCDVTVAVAYRSTSVVPTIGPKVYASAILESNQDLLTKLRPHVSDQTIFLGHGQGAVQACQLILGNNLSRQALPAFKLIGLATIDYAALGASKALLSPLGLTPANLCPLTGVKTIRGKTIPVEYQINLQDEIYGVNPATDTALGASAINAYRAIFGQDSLVDFATTPNDPRTLKVEGLGLTQNQYRAAFSHIFDDPSRCTPEGAAPEADSYYRYTLFCGQTRLLRQLKYFDYLAETPWPAIHQNNSNWDFALVDGATCYEFQYRVLDQNRIISSASIHPDGSIYITTESDLTAAQIIEPIERPPYCHLYKIDQATGAAVCASQDDVGSGVRGWGPMILKDGTIIVADLDEIYAFNPDNTVKWRRPYTGVSRTATITKEGKILIMSEAFQGVSSGFVYVLDPEDGRDLITPVSILALGGYTTVADSTNTPAVDPTTGDIINSIDFPPDPVTGIATGAYLSFKYIPGEKGSLGRLEKNWSFPIPGVSFSSPTVAADGTLFGHDGVDTTNAISREGNLIWSYNVGNVSAASHAFNPVTGNVFIVTGRRDNQTDNTDAGFFAINRKGELLWSTQERPPSQQFTFSTVPALTQNGFIYGIAQNLVGQGEQSKIEFLVVDQETGKRISSVPVETISSGFTTFNSAGEAFVTDIYPQPRFYNESPTTLPPGAIVGLHKYVPVPLSQCNAP